MMHGCEDEHAELSPLDRVQVNSEPHALSNPPKNNVVTLRDLVEGLEQVGVHPGMAVMVHSSLSAFGYVEGGEHSVIDALLHVLGRNGLLMMPTHTWGTVNVRQPVFHETLTPSIVGRVTEAFRKKPGVYRSLHPTHSVAATGNRAKEMLEGHERWSTPCSIDSPYGRLVAENGYVLFLGASLHSFTLMHAFEEWAQLPWLFDRCEDLYSIRQNGEVLYVPSRRHSDASGLERDYPALEQLLQLHGLIRMTRIGGATVRLVSAAGAKRLLVPLFEQYPDLPLARRTSTLLTCGSTDSGT